MRYITFSLLTSFLVSLFGFVPALVSAQQQDYTPVTAQRLLHPEPENWLMYRGTYDSWGYSPLDQITPANVGKLVPVWTFSTGVTEGHQAPPIVNNGVMFVTSPENQVFAFNAKTGDLLWRYERELPEDLFQLHPTNRGVALYGDKVYFGTVDTCVVALDAKNGRSGVGGRTRRLFVRLLYDPGALGGEWQNHCRHVGWRVWYPWFYPGPGCRDRKIHLENPYHSRSGRARPRELGGRELEDRRGVDLGDRQLRPGPQPHLLGAPGMPARLWARPDRGIIYIRLRSSPWTQTAGS